MNGKYDLLLCELYDSDIHDMSTYSPIMGTYHIIYEVFDGSTKLSLNKIENYTNDICPPPLNIYMTVKKMYNNDSRYVIKPEIAEYILLPGEEGVAILKTFWLRIIQKVWKKQYLKKGSKGNNVNLLKGMLYFLK